MEEGMGVWFNIVFYNIYTMKSFYASLKGICFLMLMMCWGVGFGQQPALTWAKQINDSSYNSCYTVADNQGNTYTIGTFSGTVDFDLGIGIYNLTCPVGNNTFLVKTNANGDFLWAKRLGSDSGNVYGSKVSVDLSGNIYLTGSFRGTQDFDPGAGTYNLSGGSAQSFFLLKMDLNGNFSWAKNINGTGLLSNSSIEVDHLGNLYTVGMFTQTIDFEPSTGAHIFSTASFGEIDIFIFKVNNNGDFVWAKSFNGPIGGFGNAIAIDNDENVYTTGFINSTVDFDPSVGIYNLTSIDGLNDVFISKLNAAGDFVWAKKIGGKKTDTGFGIAVDATKNVYVTGFFTDTADFDPGTATYNLKAFGSNDIFVLKLDSTGDFKWAKNMGGASSYGYMIKVDVLGNVYSAGIFDSTADFDPSPATYNLTSKGAMDIFISKLDSSGSFKFAVNIGGGNNDYFGSVSLDGAGNIYASGSFYDTIDCDPGTGTYTLSSGGHNNLFLLKLAQTTFPLHLLTFTAKRANTANLLNWTTAQEVNTDRFEIERSGNSREFSKIGVVKAGNTNYTFTDNDPLKGVNYYRLKMLDKDG